MAITKEEISKEAFDKKEAGELRHWSSYFTPECQESDDDEDNLFTRVPK